MDYESYLDRALSKLPKIGGTDERFTVPKPHVFAEGKTTVLENFASIASTLNRDPDHLLKYLLGELGTAGKTDGTRAVFQGNFSGELIEEHINAYVQEYVLCSECGKPDTHLVREERILMIKCDACGAHRSVRKRKAPPTVSAKAIQRDSEVEVMIMDVGSKGDGVAKLDRYTIFVPGARKGEKLKVRIKKVSGTLAFGERV
ncbi:translation initiation factor IF-2 subunit beta [Methermicoccus shengliensis]|uniref:Translation initiation factor 2 subunit beta n=1 Tax=Methermicoccus shengliensis TaxID=660064 RepID=A0A832RTL2_9EURY|nr:translation initiation factor IF-2 subunit beta [Methermicoccus shengliensis]KUK04074.1 MAG: Translation initiation factor 2 subunit beta [Euryarchaeota archaeon 55_53]KUK29804.1 MAG: Translation initiation factor 2 subunit beta [Methanosarcinales archeaon 56_1174]MDI3488392.1 translation initiation factor 2 subunit 2 [Methanosarcinales archaeon]MDN5295044.1 translation initiation factor 2 subunit 2 [Methanosarcinales archaeon]HIH69067.1 translation initiation factor IF-2 subunit beta [Meth